MSHRLSSAAMVRGSGLGQIRFRPPFHEHVYVNASSGYLMSYPSSSGIPFQNRPMMFPSVYQHRLEDYQPMMNPPHYEPSNYPELQHLPLSNPNNIWVQHHDNYQSQYVPENSYGVELNQNQLVTQVNKQKKKNSQKTTPACQQKATSKKRAHPSASESSLPTKTRRLNPPMEMLPIPKPDSIKGKQSHQPTRKEVGMITTHQKNPVKLSAQSQTPISQTQTQKVSTSSASYQIQLYGARVLLGTIPQLFKWNSARHKVPPIYETIGLLTEELEMIKSSSYQTEHHFTLRNPFEMDHNDSNSMPEELKCVIFNIEDHLLDYSTGAHMRVVGRFLPSRFFLCLKLRPATESDFSLLTSKTKGRVVKVNSVNYYRPPFNPQHEKQVDPEYSNKDLETEKNSDDSFFSVFTPF